MNDEFFETPLENSKVKTDIVVEYFSPWSTIMLNQTRYQHDKRIGYVDLFSGPGVYKDGTTSTPVRILQSAIENRDLKMRLVTSFNDVNAEAIRDLENTVRTLPGIDQLRYAPQFTKHEVGPEIARLFAELKLVPTLFFIDPFGYKGLSQELIGSVIGSWGCDCIFFFNYNEINRSMTIPSVKHLIDDLFGKHRAEMLRTRVIGMTPRQREQEILNELIFALKEVGGKFVLPFRFESTHQERPSHYIMFVSKAKRGYLIMKDIMVSKSTDQSEVKSLGWSPIRSPQLRMVLDFDNPYSISALKQLLLRDCAGQSLQVRRVYEDFTIDTPYVLRHTKQALIELEEAALVQIEKPSSQRRKNKDGTVTLGNNHIVTFPAAGEIECP